MINRLKQCCEKGDDAQMLSIIQDLVNQQVDRQVAGAILLEALELRPGWGPELDPKAWREEVATCLKQLYDLEDLYAALSAADNPVSEQMLALVDELFEQPIVIIEPVLESVITFERYLPDCCALLEKILATCADYVSRPEDIELQLVHIDSLDKAAELLDAALGDKFNGCRVLLVVNQLRDLLNNPEVALWQ